MNEIDNILCALAEYKVGANKVIDDAIHMIKKLEAKVRFEQSAKDSLEKDYKVMARRMEKLKEELAIKSGLPVDVKEPEPEPDPICVGDECEVYHLITHEHVGQVLVTRTDRTDGLYSCVCMSSVRDNLKPGDIIFCGKEELEKTGRRIEYQYV